MRKILFDFDHVINFPQLGHGTDFRVPKIFVILLMCFEGIRTLQQGQWLTSFHIISPCFTLFFL